MKIGIVSDSHGDTNAIDVMLSHPQAKGVEHWLFAGDIAADAEYLAMVSEVPVSKVAGNNDWPDIELSYTQVLELAGHRILLTHGHRFGVQYTTNIVERAAHEVGADLVIYGHTHVADLSVGELTVLNPGSVARPRDESRDSFMVAELIAGKRPTVKLIRI